jgi:hypothetical protein
VNIADAAQRIFEACEPLGLNAVVVRNQNPHEGIVAKKRQPDKGGGRLYIRLESGAPPNV